MAQDEEGQAAHDQQPSKWRKGSLDMNRLMARYSHFGSWSYMQWCVFSAPMVPSVLLPAQGRACS